MFEAIPSLNPYFARREQQSPSHSPMEPKRPLYVRLPRASINGSPVPHLTMPLPFPPSRSIRRSQYPGNCGGNLIRDLLRLFKPDGVVLDAMAGSGTCRDVCEELRVNCLSWDIHQGIDACDPQGFGTDAFAFIWAHPPYWRQKLYADDARDLSRSPTLEDFLRRYGQFIRNAAVALKPEGKLAILMGDFCDHEEGFVPLTWHTKRLAFAAGLRQCCTDIIRFSHGASSNKRIYRSIFIAGLHDVCMIFEKTARTEQWQ